MFDSGIMKPQVYDAIAKKPTLDNAWKMLVKGKEQDA